MVNLLPQYWQKKLNDEETVKTITIIGTVVVAALLAFILMLLLVRVSYSTELKAGEIAILEKEGQMKIFEVEPTEKNIIHDGDLISKVDDFYKEQTKVTDIFSQVVESLPPGAYLSVFSYSLNKIDLNGFAPEREQLVVFKSNLEKRPSFAKIVFPPENWLRAQDINFRVSFEYVKP